MTSSSRGSPTTTPTRILCAHRAGQKLSTRRGKTPRRRCLPRPPAPSPTATDHNQTRRKPMADKITPTLTLAALNKLDGAAEATPFTFGLAGKIVSFPDPLGLSPAEGEALLVALSGGKRATEIIGNWLSEEDAEVVLKNLTLRQMVLLIKAASSHYEASLGSVGEGSASTTA
nr:MAG TPA: hypothetical protein [Caudoviricetes sp.]